MAIKEHFEGKRDLGLIDPRKLTTDAGYNVRDLDKPEAREDLDYLKSLIRITGVQTPLRIREDDAGNLIIVRGHRRHKVVMELIAEGHEIKSVPVTQEPRGTKPDERNWDLLDSNSEAPLKGFERAEVLYRQIHVFGWSEEEILRRTGKTKQWLNTQLDLRALPESVKAQVNAGDVSATTALQVVKETRDAKTDPEFAAELIRANKEENAKIRGKRQRSTKVTARTINRDKEKLKSPVATPAQIAEVLGDPAPQQEKQNEEQRQAGAFAADQKRALAVVAPTAPPLQDISQGGREPMGGAEERDRDSGPVAPHMNKGGHNPDLSQVTERPAPPPPPADWDAYERPRTVGDVIRDDALATIERTEKQYAEAVDVLIKLTKQAHLCVQHNQSDDHPGWWSSDLVEAIRKARDVVERLTGAPMEFEAIADTSSQEEEAA